LLDIFVPGGGYFEEDKILGQPCKLFKNLGGFKFKDVTREAGLDQPLFYSHGCAVADYDRDGWPDLLVTGFGRWRCSTTNQTATAAATSSKSRGGPV